MEGRRPRLASTRFECKREGVGLLRYETFPAKLVTQRPSIGVPVYGSKVMYEVFRHAINRILQGHVRRIRLWGLENELKELWKWCFLFGNGDPSIGSWRSQSIRWP